MKAPLSWLREHAEIPSSASVEDVARAIAGVGFEVAGVDGEVIDFEITANRPDCLSVRGLAREAATVYAVRGPQSPVRGARSAVRGPNETQRPNDPTTKPIAATPPNDTKRRVSVSIDSTLCQRFALAMADVTVGPSPQWLADRLTACGIRPISNIVDVTNYVMLETGQPMHAYDATTIAVAQLTARMARAGERVKTLDGVDRTLDASMLVIADGDRAVGVAGVMGGVETEVSSSTKRIALESAWFQPASVRATSKKLGLKTEASIRFERGVDPGGQATAIERALSILEDIGAGRRDGEIADVYPTPLAPKSIALRKAKLARLLGDEIPAADVERFLGSLGFSLTPTEDGWSVAVPSHRVDVAREADLIEEVGRHWGVNRVPASFPPLRAMPRPADAGVLRARRLRRVLCGAGLQEACTFAFMEREAAEPFITDAANLVSIANPLSEKFAVLRPSLIPGLLDSLVYNRRRGMDDVRLFESGAVFSSAGETQRVAWVICGARDTHWSQDAESVDIFDALGVADLILSAWGISTVHVDPGTPANGDWFETGRHAVVSASINGVGRPQIGTVGQIRGGLVDRLGLAAGTFVVAGELDLEHLVGDGTEARKTVPLPRFPSVVRDLSLLVSASLSAAAVRATIRQPSSAILSDVREFDRYAGKGIPEGHVSLAFRLTFRDPARTLTDREVDDAMAQIIAALQRDCAATVRGL